MDANTAEARTTVRRQTRARMLPDTDESVDDVSSSDVPEDKVKMEISGSDDEHYTHQTTSNGVANGVANGGARKAKKVDGWTPGQDPKIDTSGHFEFGGSVGVTLIMVVFPLLMWYMWIGATYYDGQLPLPENGQSLAEFAVEMAVLVREGAFPSLKAWAIYWIFLLFEAVCYMVLPGVTTIGKPIPHEGGRQLPYYCSGMWSFYTTIIVAAALHVSGVFPLYTLLDEFGPLLSVAIISGFGVSVIAYVSAIVRGAQHRMTGYPIYDFFMGAELNPRLFGILDFKMFFEVRLPWYMLFFISCAAATRQYEQLGYVSGEVGLLVMAHFLYANACAKAEDLIPPTWSVMCRLFSTPDLQLYPTKQTHQPIFISHQKQPSTTH